MFGLNPLHKDPINWPFRGILCLQLHSDDRAEPKEGSLDSVGDAEFARILKLSLVRISFTAVCQNQFYRVLPILTNASKGNSD